jgi:hypothetical protein
MENSFWNCHTGGDFVDWFQKSVTLYVESGMRKKVEVAVKMLVYNPVEPLGPGFKKEFLKIIMDHYLRKFRCLHWHSEIL